MKGRDAGTMAAKRIVILGGGYGGVHAAKRLYKKFKRREDVQITLIDKNPYHTLMTELHEIAGSRTDPEAVQVGFKKIFAGTTVNVVTDQIDSIDFPNNELISDTARYNYDYLIIGAGGAPEFFGIEGVQENSFTLWSLEDAIRIRTQVDACFREAAREPNPEKRRRMLTFTIAGAGFTGIELAGELMERRDVLCSKYHVRKNEVRIVVVEMMDNILPSLPVRLQQKAKRYLEDKGVEIMLNSPIVKAEPGVVRIEDGTEVRTDTFVWTAGIHGCEFSAHVPLTKGHVSGDECSQASPEGIHGMAGCHFDEDERYIVGERGRVLVTDEMRSVDFDNVYLVGDMIWYVEGERVVPQIVETAIQTADVAAHNVATRVKGKGSEKKFKSNYHGQMVSLGSKRGVAHVMGVSLNGMAALAIKHLINLHYLVGLAGFNAVWEYLQGQFLNVKDGRSLTGSHLSYKLPVYWSFPLRVFVGVSWLIEGVSKVSTGWLNPGEGGIFNPSPGNIYIPGIQFSDGVSAATSATPNGGNGAAYGDTVLQEAIGIYTWFAETVLSAHPIVAYAAQVLVVVGQVGIGILLIAGLFTFLASLGSIGMGVMFVVSGWGSSVLLWYIAASIVFLGGAGRGLGLDHWVIPWLKKWWNGTWLARKTYLYSGEPVLH